MKKRQKLRRVLLFLSLFTFPLTIYYFSPALPIFGASQGIITGSICTFIFLFASSTLFGRLFCAYLCPAGAIQEFLSPVNSKAVRKGRWIKYSIWVPWISLILYLFITAGGIKMIDFFFMTTHGISIAQAGDFIVYYIVGSIIIVPTLIVGRRSPCHHICWMSPFMILGKKISEKIRVPNLMIIAQKERCTDCQICTSNCPMSLEVNRLLKKGEIRNSDCILCGECVDNCPEDVLHYGFNSCRKS